MDAETRRDHLYGIDHPGNPPLDAFLHICILERLIQSISKLPDYAANTSVCHLLLEAPGPCVLVGMRVALVSDRHEDIGSGLSHCGQAQVQEAKKHCRAAQRSQY
jgi:hypothetical protein